jgi:hypothetical protein
MRRATLCIYIGSFKMIHDIRIDTERFKIFADKTFFYCPRIKRIIGHSELVTSDISLTQ